MGKLDLYRCSLLLSTVLLSSSLSACGQIPATTSVHILDAEETVKGNKNESSLSDFIIPENSESSEQTENSQTKTETPESTGVDLTVRGSTIYFGESTESIIRKLGSPNRIDETEYDFTYYIYNNDYKNLLFVAVKDDKAVGFYTDAIDFNLMGVTSGSDINDVNQILNQSFERNNILVHTTDQYSLNILMDRIGTQKVTGIYLLASDIKEGKYSDSVKRNIELMVYDLTNSIRVRNGKEALSWSSSAASAARKHSSNMAENNYFNHKDLLGRTPGERLHAEGIAYRTSGENIIAGYGTAILSTHGWFNSPGHRDNILHSKFRYLGVGFVYLEDSHYKTYLTQSFFR